MADGYFRSKQGFTVVQNAVTRDKQISLKAKGLYLVIQSYITLPDKKWMKSEFMNMVSEGKAAFDNAWNELKNNGYLHVHIFSDGRNFTYEYELLNEPEDGPHTFYYNSKGELTSTNESRASKKNGVKSADSCVGETEESQENTRVSRDTDFRYIGNRCNGNHSNGNQYNGNRSNGDRADGKGGNNNNSLNINPNNNDCNINTSIQSYPIQENESDSKADAIDTMDECSSYMDLIKNNISYVELMRYFDPEKRQRFDEMYQLICDVVCVPRDTVRVNGQAYPYQLVKSQFLKLTKDHLEYVSDCMDINLGKVNNIRAYLVTALYNAPATFSNHVAQVYRTENHSEYESDYDVQHKQKLEYMKRLKEEDYEKYKEFLKSEIERQRREGTWYYD